ncbi:hypothetical protein LTR86_009591 [Recurvomyces mirabilis]|nr:hypothetical protein LTR86_009591 [Recurvomyces mirabilis]
MHLTPLLTIITLATLASSTTASPLATTTVPSGTPSLTLSARDSMAIVPGDIWTEGDYLRQRFELSGSDCLFPWLMITTYPGLPPGQKQNFQCWADVPGDGWQYTFDISSYSGQEGSCAVACAIDQFYGVCGVLHCD